MSFNTSVITRKGQVTIPIEIRRALGFNEGDRVMFIREGNDVRITTAHGVAARTAGMLSAYRREPPLTIREEKEAFVQAVAEEVAASMRREVEER
jgi:AbrB family looped-hinge helix DNA binding protein